ncbi:hypothetical protein [Flavobacterium sp. HNIBRBA15423]|uniref:hypothetical protein n=1 Tax=Flavobacterium sp. HNIBRBA15423 TaxID=3458683 RepID=UPI004044A328
MQTRTNLNDKNNAFKLSIQVKNILHEKGYSFLFNFNDYKFFKKQVNQAFNKGLAIAEKFIEYYGETQNDYSDYVF